MLFYARKNEYDAGEGPIRYLDGSSLSRPLDMPKPQIAILVVFVIIAAIIGGTFLFNMLGSITHSAARSQATLEENLARPASSESLPGLASLLTLDDESIKASFAESGFVIYDMSSDGGSLDLVKLPEDVSTAEAAVLYAQGTSNLSAAEAALILNGSWRITVDRGDTTNLSLKYADFSSGSVQAAIEAAMVAEGLDVTTLGESGTDDAGNTFQNGTIDVGGSVYTWRVSAISLSSVYDISGLPESATYVGIRITS